MALSRKLGTRMNRLQHAINELQLFQNELQSDFGLRLNAPREAVDFVPWFLKHLRALGVESIPARQLEQAFKSYKINTPHTAGHWLNNFGYDGRPNAAQRWYDITRQKSGEYYVKK